MQHSGYKPPEETSVQLQLLIKWKGIQQGFLMKRAEGVEVVAKIPCCIAGPPLLTTAGEVGVLECRTSYVLDVMGIFWSLTLCNLVRRRTSIPVPRCHFLSSHSSNAVDAKFIIMEKAAGVSLFQQWGSMTEIEK